MMRTDYTPASVVATMILGFMVWLSPAMQGQTRLELLDQLPPYLLNATLLNNGHFSVTTNYTGENKTLIYREDGTGNRPVNYTSHVHVNIDDVIFQLPFENDPGTDLPPPPNPLKVLRLFRDTVGGRPRVNADLLAIMPSTTDSIIATFTMEPVSRPSGGFIRMSVSVLNKGSIARNIGVLMLIDTKIGDNDRAPIGTALGYSGLETQFDQGVPPGMPEYWIALEGTPLAPGLTARGNLQASELIEPDRCIVGNWVDDAGAGIPGLFRTLWNERTASGLRFTDSAVLLIWDQDNQAPGSRRLRAATEIGLVDSLNTAFGSGGGGGGGGGSIGVAGSGSCLTVTTDTEVPCGEPGYTPYQPPSVQSLYLVTNTGTNNIQDLELRLGALPPGVRSVALSTPLIPALLAPDATGVCVLNVDLVPRLQATSYDVPIAFVDGSGVTILEDTVCITVPGIQGAIRGDDLVTLPVCPGEIDTVYVTVESFGIRCLPVSQVNILTQPANATLATVLPFPTLPAEDAGLVGVEVTAIAEGRQTARVEVIVRDYETLTDGDTTWVELRDTVDVEIVVRPSELDPILTGDTLDLGVICIGDTRVDSLLVQNLGGCVANITQLRMADDAGGVFTVPPNNTLPVAIDRGMRRDVYVAASSATDGTFRGALEITTPARPGTITVPIRIVVERPRYTVDQDTIDLDTVCPGIGEVFRLGLQNPTACNLPIDSITTTSADLNSSTPGALLIGPRSNVSLAVSVTGLTSGTYEEVVFIHSAVADTQRVVVRWVIADRSAQAPASADLGDIRVGTPQTQLVQVRSVGNAPITITQLRLSGAAAAEYSVEPANGQPLPQTIAPAGVLDVQITGVPAGIEGRTATLLIETAQGSCATPDPMRLTMRGVLPLLDITRTDVVVRDVCVGSQLDTTVTVRNVGNAALTISQIAATGSDWFTPVDVVFPIVLDSGEQFELPIRVVPAGIGSERTEFVVTMDGEWFTPLDTTLRMSVRGVLCGTLRADTSTAPIGLESSVTVRLVADERTTLTSEELTQMLVLQGAPVEIQLGVVPTIARFTGEVGGGLAGGLTDLAPDRITISLAQLSAVQPFASVGTDVLLGPLQSTPITVDVLDLADGLYDLRIHDGLLRAEYCAWDQRTVTTSGNLLVWSVLQGNTTAIRVYTATSMSVTIDVCDISGRTLSSSVLHCNERETQTHLIRGLTSGAYAIRVTGASESYALPMIVTE